MLQRIFSTGIILLITLTEVFADRLDGFWEVDQNGDIVEIRMSSEGLKARFANEGNWDHYEYVRKGIYENRRGSRYIELSADRLEWESRDQRQIYKLYRLEDHESFGSLDRGGRHFENGGHLGRRQNGRLPRETRPGICGPACATGCTIQHGNEVWNNRNNGHFLNGTWTNRFRTRMLYVDYNGAVLRIKSDRSRNWTTFRKIHRRKLNFEDRFGNQVRINNNGELRWRGNNGRTMIFRRTNYL